MKLAHFFLQIDIRISALGSFIFPPFLPVLPLYSSFRILPGLSNLAFQSPENEPVLAAVSQKRCSCGFLSLENVCAVHFYASRQIIQLLSPLRTQRNKLFHQPNYCTSSATENKIRQLAKNVQSKDLLGICEVKVEIP